MITIEIKGLDDHPDLQKVILLNLTDIIKTTTSHANSKTLLIIDEAWRLFTDSGRDFAIEAYRTFKKYNAGIWCISQNYRDFLSDEYLADTLLPNTASIFMLKQQGIDWHDLQEKLQLNDSELEIAKGVQIKRGEYAELFLIQGEERGLVKIVPDDLGYQLASNNCDDLKIVRNEKERTNWYCSENPGSSYN